MCLFTSALRASVNKSHIPSLPQNNVYIAVTTDESIEEVFSIYSTFEEASGAKLNRGKSKGMWLGAWKSRTDTPFGLSWVKELPLLGATFSMGDYIIPTWEKPVAKLESRLSAWSGRSLSLQGKTTIINVLALSQIWHLCHVFAIPAWASKPITKALWSSFCSGKKYLVACTTVCLPSLGEALVSLILKGRPSPSL
jgi:hypothetical protein